MKNKKLKKKDRSLPEYLSLNNHNLSNSFSRKKKSYFLEKTVSSAPNTNAQSHFFKKHLSFFDYVAEVLCVYFPFGQI